MYPYQFLQAGEGKAVDRTASEIAEPHLGHIIENNLVQLALWQQFNEQVQVVTDTQIVALQQSDSSVIVTLSDDRVLTAKLLIGADGAHSAVRQLAGIGTQGWQYQQACLVALLIRRIRNKILPGSSFTQAVLAPFYLYLARRRHWYGTTKRLKLSNWLSFRLLRRTGLY
ncbi:FAD-dependent monooxygenase [Alishewanella longhuensis]